MDLIIFALTYSISALLSSPWASLIAFPCASFGMYPGTSVGTYCACGTTAGSIFSASLAPCPLSLATPPSHRPTLPLSLLLPRQQPHQGQNNQPQRDAHTHSDRHIMLRRLFATASRRSTGCSRCCRSCSSDLTGSQAAKISQHPPTPHIERRATIKTLSSCRIPAYTTGWLIGITAQL